MSVVPSSREIRRPQGARGTRDEVERLADHLGAGVAKALLGKDALPDDLPYVTGSIGLLGTRPSYEMMRDCDTLVVVGPSFPYTRFLPGDAIVTADSGSAANWYARHLRMRGSMRGSLSGTLATMGPGVPYAIGAKFAHPDRPAIALVGDGAMQMNGLAELITAAKYYEEWQDPRLVVAVLNNRDLNQVTWEMRAMSGAPQFLPSQAIPDVPYADVARSFGLDGVRVETPDGVVQALAADRPFVIGFRTDPAVPPIPPHATLDQIEAATASIVKGDSDRAGMVRQGFRAKIQEMLPGGPERRRSGGRKGW